MSKWLKTAKTLPEPRPGFCLPNPNAAGLSPQKAMLTATVNAQIESDHEISRGRKRKRDWGHHSDSENDELAEQS